MVIKIGIIDKRPSVEGAPVIVCGNSDYVIEFSFDDEWRSAAVKTARFAYVQAGAPKYQEVAFTGNTVQVPILSNIREVLVGVYAGTLRTTAPARIPCKRSILCGDEVHDEPPEDVYQQLLDVLNMLSTRVDEIVDLSVADDIVLDAHLVRMVQDAPVGVQRYVQLNVPADGAALCSGAWMLRIWRRAEGSALLVATHESGQQLRRVYSGTAKAVLSGETVDSWKVETEHNGNIVNGPSCLLMGGGRMTVQGPKDPYHYAFASLQLPGSEEWKDYTVNATLTYKTANMYHAGLAYNVTDACHYQKAAVFKNGSSASKCALNGRWGDASAWLNNQNQMTLPDLERFGDLTQNVPFKVTVETNNMSGNAPGTASMTVLLMGEENMALDPSVVGWTVNNIDAKTYKGTVGFVVKGPITLEVSEIEVWDKDYKLLYRADFSGYGGGWGEWLQDCPSALEDRVLALEETIGRIIAVLAEHGMTI